MAKFSSRWSGLLLLLSAGLLLAALVTQRNHLRRWWKRGPEPRGTVLHLKFFSPALGRDADYWAWLPPGFDASGRTRYPALYLLHGMFRDHTAYVNRVDADLAAEKLLAAGEIAPLVLVMPEGDSSFYVNWKDDPAGRWEDFIVRDLIAEADRRFPTRGDRRGRGIGGFSMGGFGAMRLALLHRERFGSASSQYGAFQIAASDLPYLGGKLKQAFGPDPAAYGAQSPLELISSTGLQPGELAVYLDAGEDDAWALDEQAREFDRQLTTRGIAHVFQIFPGNHTDSYLRERVAEALRFHSRVFQEKTGLY